MSKYTFKISNSRPFWSINSIDKPYDINEYMTWSTINIQNVNFIDSFTISFIADKDDYTYLAITDITPSSTNAATKIKYYYIETTSKRLTKGYEFVGKLDVWATFCGKTMVEHTRFPKNNYPLFVNRFLHNNPKIWTAYYASSAYMLKDEMFDYSHLPLTTDPNGYAISNPDDYTNRVAKHNMFFTSFFVPWMISFYHYGIFATSFQNPGREFMMIGQDNPPSFNAHISGGNSALYNVSAFRMHNKYSSPLLGLLYQADNKTGTYRLVICGLKACGIIIARKLHYSLTDYRWYYNSSYSTNNDYIIRLAGLQETIAAIKTGYGNIEGGDPQGYWHNKIKGIYYFDFIDMLEIGKNKWYFTSLAGTTQGDMVKVYNSGLTDSATYNFDSIAPGIFFRDFEPQEGIPIHNRQKWRFTSIPTDPNYVLTDSTNKPSYFIWNTYAYNCEPFNTSGGIIEPTFKNNMFETYTRNGDNVNYLQRYPLSRISVDNVCLNPSFADHLNLNYMFNTRNYYGSTGFFDTGYAMMGFDGASWVMSTGYNSKYLLTSAFTQESYPCNYEGYADYINGVRSQQDAALKTAKNQAIFGGVMGGLSGLLSIITGGIAAFGASKGDSSLLGDAVSGIGGGVLNIANSIGGSILGYQAKERQIEAQNQDKRRTSQVNVVQAGNKEALGMNLAKANWYNLPSIDTSLYKYITNTVSCNFPVNAPNSLTDIHYYNSLVWKFGIQANFLIDAYTILYPFGAPDDNNPFTYFEIQELPAEFILRIYPNLQKDYVNAIKAVFSGGVRQWMLNKYPKYDSNDNVRITWR